MTIPFHQVCIYCTVFINDQKVPASCRSKFVLTRTIHITNRQGRIFYPQALYCAAIGYKCTYTSGVLSKLFKGVYELQEGKKFKPYSPYSQPYKFSIPIPVPILPIQSPYNFQKQVQAYTPQTPMVFFQGHYDNFKSP